MIKRVICTECGFKIEKTLITKVIYHWEEHKKKTLIKLIKQNNK